MMSSMSDGSVFMATIDNPLSHFGHRFRPRSGAGEAGLPRQTASSLFGGLRLVSSNRRRREGENSATESLGWRIGRAKRGTKASSSLVRPLPFSPPPVAFGRDAAVEQRTLYSPLPRILGCRTRPSPREWWLPRRWRPVPGPSLAAGAVECGPPAGVPPRTPARLECRPRTSTAGGRVSVRSLRLLLRRPILAASQLLRYGVEHPMTTARSIFVVAALLANPLPASPRMGLSSAASSRQQAPSSSSGRTRPFLPKLASPSSCRIRSGPAPTAMPGSR